MTTTQRMLSDALNAYWNAINRGRMDIAKQRWEYYTFILLNSVEER